MTFENFYLEIAQVARETNFHGEIAVASELVDDFFLGPQKSAM